MPFRPTLARPTLARLPLPTALRLWAALLLAAIGLQVASPVARPLEVRHGSAFSAATVDVALAPQRRIESVRVADEPQPALPPQPVAVTPLAATILSDLPAVRPHSTGPPARDILAWQPAPRGPPAA